MPSGAVCARMGCYNTGVTRGGLAVEVVSVVLFGSEWVARPGRAETGL